MASILRLAALVTMLLLGRFSLAEEVPGFKVIVNAANPVASLSKDKVSKLFLKKVTKWENGHTVMPVDLIPSSPARGAFSKAVHGKDLHEIEAYWQELIFSGREVPPPVKAYESYVVEYVKTNPDAIGYVSMAIAVSEVKVVKLDE
ncbi:MAG: substrate-binding domain-containing protein [Acidobacteria bacterium]|nr:substrate-binding domain-containing protein [Acidobacteriota bacterium]